MGDVAIFIGKNGRVTDLSKGNATDPDTNDNEDEDDIDENGSGSGGSSLTSTTPDSPVITTPIKQQVSSPDDANNVPIIVAAVCGVVILIVLIVLFIFWRRRRRRRQREKSLSIKPLPHPSSMDSNSSRATLAVRPTGDGYYTATMPLYPSAPPGDDLPPPMEPPPPPPNSKKSPSHTRPGNKYQSARYTKLHNGGAAATNNPNKEENIYESIDEMDINTGELGTTGGSDLGATGGSDLGATGGGELGAMGGGDLGATGGGDLGATGGGDLEAAGDDAEVYLVASNVSQIDAEDQADNLLYEDPAKPKC